MDLLQHRFQVSVQHLTAASQLGTCLGELKLPHEVLRSEDPLVDKSECDLSKPFRVGWQVLEAVKKKGFQSHAHFEAQ